MNNIIPVFFSLFVEIDGDSFRRQSTSKQMKSLQQPGVIGLKTDLQVLSFTLEGKLLHF